MNNLVLKENVDFMIVKHLSRTTRFNLPKLKDKGKVFTVKNDNGESLKIRVYGVYRGRRVLKKYQAATYVNNGKSWIEYPDLSKMQR